MDAFKDDPKKRLVLYGPDHAFESTGWFVWAKSHSAVSKLIEISVPPMGFIYCIHGDIHKRGVEVALCPKLQKYILQSTVHQTTWSLLFTCCSTVVVPYLGFHRIILISSSLARRSRGKETIAGEMAEVGAGLGGYKQMVVSLILLFCWPAFLSL